MINNDVFIEKDIISLYMKDINKFKPLKPADEALYAAQIRKGDKIALEKLIKANLRFVISVARTYQDQGVPLIDLINEGNIGLIKAAYKFDEKKNFKFISYAVWWIRQSILQALADQSRIYKVPLNRVATIYKIGKLDERLEQKLKRRPFDDEIAFEGRINEETIETTRKIDQNHWSLDTPIGNKKDAIIGDIINNKNSMEPDTKIVEQSTRDAIVRILDILNEREKQILMLYYGLSDHATYTLEDIGKRLHLTRERVRQIKDRALERLRRPDIKQLLHEYLSLN